MNSILWAAFQDEILKIAEAKEDPGDTLISHREVGLVPETKKVPRYSVVGEKGEAPQGVSFRKKFHHAEDAKGGKVIASNDARKGTVTLHGKMGPKAQAALHTASEKVKQEKGFRVKARKLPGKTTLEKVEISPKALDAASNKQGYTPEFLAGQGISNPKPGRSFYGASGRYGPKRSLKLYKKGPQPELQQTLAKDKYIGYLAPGQIRQLQGKDPIYRKQLSKGFVGKTTPEWHRPGGKYWNDAERKRK